VRAASAVKEKPAPFHRQRLMALSLGQTSAFGRWCSGKVVLLAAGGAARWGTTTHINHSQLDADATAAAA